MYVSQPRNSNGAMSAVDTAREIFAFRACTTTPFRPFFLFDFFVVDTLESRHEYSREKIVVENVVERKKQSDWARKAPKSSFRLLADTLSDTGSRP